jgi:hypothetical protein
MHAREESDEPAATYGLFRIESIAKRRYNRDQKEGDVNGYDASFGAAG